MTWENLLKENGEPSAPERNASARFTILHFMKVVITDVYLNQWHIISDVWNRNVHPVILWAICSGHRTQLLASMRNSAAVTSSTIGFTSTYCMNERFHPFLLHSWEVVSHSLIFVRQLASDCCLSLYLYQIPLSSFNVWRDQARTWCSSWFGMCTLHDDHLHWLARTCQT